MCVQKGIGIMFRGEGPRGAMGYRARTRLDAQVWKDSERPTNQKMGSWQRYVAHSGGYGQGPVIIQYIYLIS